MSTQKTKTSPRAETAAAEPASSPPGELVRLQKVLAAAGIGSRRHCEEYIRAGRVSVDGQTVRELGIKVDPERQQVRLDGEPVAVERKVYYLVNKPTGFVSTNSDPQGRRRVVDLLPHSRERLFTVGRLDEESQGLMVVTNDGELAHRLAHPRFGVPKTYRVQVAGVPTRESLQQLRTGIEFTEGVFKVESVRQVRKLGKSALLEVVLTEGQNREIRRLLARLGHKVMRLERIALGPIKLIRVPIGQFRPLTAYELEQLRALAAGQPRPKGPRRPPGRAPARGSAPRPSKAGRAERRRPASRGDRS